MLLLVAWLAYGSVSVFLIIFFVIFLGKSKEFNYSFYRLVQCDLFLNLLTYISTWVRRLCVIDETIPLMIDVYYNYHFFFHMAGFCADFFFHVQSLSCISLCVNRFTTARFRNANQFWSKHYLGVYILICIASTAYILPLYLNRFIRPVMYNETTKSFTFEPGEPWKTALYWKMFSIISTSYFAIIITFGLLTLLVLNQRFSVIELTTQNRQIMRKMAIIVSINTCIYLTVILWNIFVSNSTIMMMSVSDIISLSMPYILLICDRNVSRAILNSMKRKSPSSIMMIIPKSSINS